MKGFIIFAESMKNPRRTDSDVAIVLIMLIMCHIITN